MHYFYTYQKYIRIFIFSRLQYSIKYPKTFNVTRMIIQITNLYSSKTDKKSILKLPDESDAFRNMAASIIRSKTPF